MQAAIESGESIDQFRARFGEIVQKRGWQGWTGEGTEAGTNWRTRIIYRTNMATSHAAGRYAQLQDFPLWVYRHSGAEHPRLQHKAFDGLTLPKDDPFWATHYPPNGWGCGCRVFGARDEAGAARVGGTHTQPPEGWNEISPETGEPFGVDEGWGYAPGASVADKFRGLIPEMVDEPPEGVPILPPICPASGRGAHAREECPGPFPVPRSFGERLLPDGKHETYYVDAFLDCFGTNLKDVQKNGPVPFVDVTGEVLAIGDALFTDKAASAKAGKTIYKVKKNGRHRYVRMLAETIKYPQEKWDQWEWLYAAERMELRARYLALWEVRDEPKPALSSFVFVPKRWWTGATTFVPEDVEEVRTWQEYMERQRTGYRRYRKE